MRIKLDTEKETTSIPKAPGKKEKELSDIKNILIDRD